MISGSKMFPTIGAGNNQGTGNMTKITGPPNMMGVPTAQQQQPQTANPHGGYMTNSRFSFILFYTYR